MLVEYGFAIIAVDCIMAVHGCYIFRSKPHISLSPAEIFYYQLLYRTDATFKLHQNNNFTLLYT